MKSPLFERQPPVFQQENRRSGGLSFGYFFLSQKDSLDLLLACRTTAACFSQEKRRKRNLLVSCQKEFLLISYPPVKDKRLSLEQNSCRSKQTK
jgi:hypothetical protein